MTNIAPLARDWLDAKTAEDEARKRRIDIEKHLASAIGVPQEGAKTRHIDGYKITATQPVSRKVSPEGWALVSTKLPFEMHPVRMKLEADATGCKYLADKEPELWAKVASAFTVTPGKVSFKIEEESE